MAAALIATSLVIGALYAWETAPDLASDLQSSRPDVAVWAMRSAAVALIALAQAMVVHFVIGGLYPRRSIDEALRLCFGIACVLACVSAIALGFAAH